MVELSAPIGTGADALSAASQRVCRVFEYCPGFGVLDRGVETPGISMRGSVDDILQSPTSQGTHFGGDAVLLPSWLSGAVKAKDALAAEAASIGDINLLSVMACSLYASQS